jgi:hypothetical protein
VKRVVSLIAAAMLIGTLAVPTSALAESKGCQGLDQALSTIQLPPGYWTVGTHTYWTHYVDRNPDPAWNVDFWFGPYTFTVDPAAPLHQGNVTLPTLDLWGSLQSIDGPIADNTINPAQRTFFYGGWSNLPMTADTWFAWGFPGSPYTMAQWKAEIAMSPISFRWDSGEEVVGTMGPLQSMCVGTGGGDWFLRSWGRKF